MKAPKHGVTGMALSGEEVQAFMDYLVDATPTKAKVHRRIFHRTRSRIFVRDTTESCQDG